MPSSAQGPVSVGMGVLMWFVITFIVAVPIVVIKAPANPEKMLADALFISMALGIIVMILFGHRSRGG